MIVKIPYASTYKVLSVQSDQFDIRLTISDGFPVDCSHSANHAEKFTIICRSALECTVSIGNVGNVEWLSDGPILEMFVGRRAAIFFRGNIDAVEAMLGKIFLIANDHFGGWADISDFVNPLIFDSDGPEVLENGKLLSGPELFVKKAYSAISGHGNFSFVEGSPGQPGRKFGVLVVGDSYVICQSIEVS